MGVSVPYRGATFLNNTSTLPRNILSGFRPLSGSYISQCENSNSQENDSRFRPLSGSYIAQWDSGESKETEE